jgi:hypothetical protein
MFSTPTRTKKEVAKMLNISTGTLRIWLNVRYYNDLLKIGYEKKHRILTPAVLNYLKNKIDLQE